MSEERPRRRRRGIGCLPSLVLLIVFGLGLMVAVQWVTHPWIYLVGGKTRLLPIWQGVGVADGPGGRYTVYVSFSPRNNGSRMFPGESIDGRGWICSPLGQRYSLRITGGANGRIWSGMDGHAFAITAEDRPWNWQGSRYETWRPRLRFLGFWAGPNLQMTDQGSLAHAFNADGSLNKASSYNYNQTTGAPITFNEVNWVWPRFGCSVTAP